MRLPKKIDILGLIFDVKYFDFEKKVQNCRHVGSQLTYKQSMEIDNTAHPEYQEMTLLHEILHGISDLLNLNLDEDQVKRLGVALYQVLKDNKLLA